MLANGSVCARAAGEPEALTRRIPRSAGISMSRTRPSSRHPSKQPLRLRSAKLGLIRWSQVVSSRSISTIFATCWTRCPRDRPG